MKNILVNIFLLFFSFLFTIFSLEAAYRFYLFKQEDSIGSIENIQTNAAADIGKTNTLAKIIQKSNFDDVVYRLIPNMKVVFMGHEVQTNAFAGRGAEIKEKNLDTTRILGIGDSIQFGWGVEESDTYIKKLSDKLQSNSCKSEVLNFGVPGYNTAMEIATLEKILLPLKPDYVILHVVGNDLELPRFMEAKENYLTSRKLFLIDFVKEKFFTAKSGDNDLLDLQKDFIRRANKYTVQNQYSWMTGRKSFKKSIEKFIKLSQDNKFVPVVLLSTSDGHINKILNSFAELKVIRIKSYVDDYFNKVMPNASKKERFIHLTIGGNDPHPNGIGHGLYSDALYDYFKGVCSEHSVN